MMSWINTLRTSAEDLGTVAENEPPTYQKGTVDDTRIHTCIHVSLMFFFFQMCTDRSIHLYREVQIITGKEKQGSKHRCKETDMSTQRRNKRSNQAKPTARGQRKKENTIEMNK